MQPSNASTTALAVVRGVHPQDLHNNDGLRQQYAGTQLTPVQAAMDGMLVDLPRGPRPAVITSRA